jgi:hypothetical protein
MTTETERTALERIANWPDGEMFTSLLAPAQAMRAIAKDALASAPSAPQPTEVPSDFDALAEHHRATEAEVERLKVELAEMVRRLELSTNNTDMAIKLLEARPVENGIRYDEETDSYIASHRITSVAHTAEFAKLALASAIHMTSQAWPIQPESAPSSSSQGQERTALIAEARVCAEELDDAAGSCYDGAQSCSGTGEKQEEARCMRRYHRLAKAENIISRLADALEALSSSAPADPIAAAVDAQLDPLKDELIAMGHRLAKETEKSNAECEHYWVYDFAVEAHTCVRCGKRIDNAAAARLINTKAGAPR